MLRPLILGFLILLALPLTAQDNEVFNFGDDVFQAGRSVSNVGDGVDDLFAAGDRVTSSGALSGSAHMFGRNVTLSGDVGENVYAIGRNVTISAPIAGDAVLAGEDVAVTGAIGGDLRAMGSRVEVSAPVGDAALLAGELVIVNAAIAGDLGLAANEIEFGPDAVVEGNLHIYSDDPAAVEVPGTVVSADRIVLHETEEWGGVMSDPGGHMQVSAWQKFRGFVGGILAVTLLTTLLAAIAPNFVARLRERALDASIRVGWIGFLAMSATIGSLVMFAMTGFGLLLVPVSIIAAILLGVIGYLVGTYVLGVGLMRMTGRDLPDSLGDRALVAFVGAAAAAVIGLVPFLGWLFVLALMLVGAGALIVRWFGPGFYTAIE